jgi:hypothetical protein
MNNKKRYKIRIYVFDKTVGNIINLLIRIKAIRLENSMDGVNGCLAIYDGVVATPVLLEVMKLTKVFPLDSYEDFVITCPVCGERIDDDMILTTYDENLLSGYNIDCEREHPDAYHRINRFGCGYQMANVEFTA